MEPGTRCAAQCWLLGCMMDPHHTIREPNHLSPAPFPNCLDNCHHAAAHLPYWRPPTVLPYRYGVGMLAGLLGVHAIKGLINLIPVVNLVTKPILGAYTSVTAVVLRLCCAPDKLARCMTAMSGTSDGRVSFQVLPAGTMLGGAGAGGVPMLVAVPPWHGAAAPCGSSEELWCSGRRASRLCHCP